MPQGKERRGVPRHPDLFSERHIGPRPEEVARMLSVLGLSSLNELVDHAVPRSIRMDRDLALPPPLSDRKAPGKVFVVSGRCHPQTIEVVRGRAEPLGIEMVVEDPAIDPLPPGAFGVLLQYPTTDGEVLDYESVCAMAHQAGALVVVAADLLSLTLLRPPGEFGADVVVGSTQRLGVP